VGARSRLRSRVAAIAGASLLLAPVGCGGDSGQDEAVQLSFISTPTTVILGRPFSVVVQAQDRSGHGAGTTQGGQLIDIQLGLGASPTAGSLGGPDSTIAGSDGNATFQALTLDIPGQYALTASVPGVAAIPRVTSGSFSAIAPPSLVDVGP